MATKTPSATRSAAHPFQSLVLTLGVTLMLAACGGGGGGSSANSSDSTATAAQPADTATGDTTLDMSVDTLPASVATQTVQAAFQLAPGTLDEPADATAASDTPHTQTISQGLPAALSLYGATDGSVSPMASGSVVTTYTPAQIRAAYGMPALPASGATPTATQAAQMGAGQTIYIIDAMHDPNAATELAAFNQKFALPTCTTKSIATNVSLPLASASKTACEFSVVYTTAGGSMTTAAPAYDSGWATEIALDVQWVHATAPLARIILIEAPDASINSLTNSIKLANIMGPGIVSMSFGAAEGSWTTTLDSTFSNTSMTYLAATGDSGAGVSWPAVSPYVLAVGGTTLTYNGSGMRSEVSWSGTGGGTSLYTATPNYQSAAVPGLGSVAHRTVADVAFNADPSTGQYVVVIPSSSTAVQWLSAGGTSLSTPQWAGLIASANASRVAAAKAVLGAPHSILYGQISTAPATYASVFADVTQGSDGSCSTCSARTGYDPLSGLGTPNATTLINTLSGASTTSPAPVITAASISGTVGTALTFTVSVTASHAVTYTLTGAPAGMSISSSGVVSWAAPLLGTYNVTVTARDSVTGLTGQGIYTILIAAKPTAPVVNSATISGKPGVALNFSVSVSSSTPVSYTLSGAPAGMTITSGGTVTWANPVVGTYTVTVTAKSTSNGLTGQGIYTIKIAASGPVVTAPGSTGTAGQVLTGTISISDPGATRISITIANAPLGMQFAFNGTSIIYYWPYPIRGSYSMKVTVTDSFGLTTQVNVPITVK